MSTRIFSVSVCWALLAIAGSEDVQGLIATIQVLRDDGTTGSDLLLELRSPMDSGLVLPGGWRLCFTWMKAVVLLLPSAARRMGSYVELPPEPTLEAGDSRAFYLRIAPPAMRYASDLPQGLHVAVMVRNVEGVEEELVLPVRLQPPMENNIRKDLDAQEKTVTPLLLVPRPEEETVSEGSGFAFMGVRADPVTVVVKTAEAEPAASLLKTWIESWPPGSPLAAGSAAAALIRDKETTKKGRQAGSSWWPPQENDRSRHISFLEATDRHERTWFGPEGYELNVAENSIRIVAVTVNGFHRAAATLRQALGLAYSDGKEYIYPVRVRDRPRFRYRGLMLDVARHFFPSSFVMRVLDWMYLLKLNVFHWHLTDDEGWRLEVRALPNLTIHGAWRGRGEAVEPQYGGGPERYGGYYTQQTVRDLVSYAGARGIDIVPEIDVPGHCYAAIKSLPDLLGPAVRWTAESGKSPTSVQGFRGNVLDPAAPATYEFLEAVFSEVLELFPTPLGVHIGMDEVPRGAWSDSQEEEAQLLAQLARWLQLFLAKRGRTLIGWEEAFEGQGLQATSAPPVAVAWKEDERSAPRAAVRGFDVVLSPAHFLYLDTVQGQDFEDRGLYWACPTLSLERVYSYEPMVRMRNMGMPLEVEPRIRGIQAALWGETVATPERAEEMLFPRLLAVAEIAWTTAGRKNWVDFKWRLSAQLRWLHEIGLVTHGGSVCGLVVGSEYMILPRTAPHGSGDPAGIVALPTSLTEAPCQRVAVGDQNCVASK